MTNDQPQYGAGNGYQQELLQGLQRARDGLKHTQLLQAGLVSGACL